MNQDTTCALGSCENETGGYKFCSKKCKGRFAYEKRLQKMAKCPECGGPYQGAGAVQRGVCNKCNRKRSVGPGDEGPCAQCGRTFRNGTKSLLAICPACKHEAMKARAAERGPCVVPWCESPQFCKSYCIRHYWEQHAGQEFSKPVPCDICGEPLEYTRRVDDEESATRMHARCKPVGARFISERERSKIYERDEYTCQICGGAAFRRVDGWSPWEVTLDHIVPQSALKVADHSPENLRTVHSICNTFRGAATRTDAEVVEKLKEWEATTVGD